MAALVCIIHSIVDCMYYVSNDRDDGGLRPSRASGVVSYAATFVSPCMVRGLDVSAVPCICKVVFVAQNSLVFRHGWRMGADRSASRGID